MKLDGGEGGVGGQVEAVDVWCSQPGELSRSRRQRGEEEKRGEERRGGRTLCDDGADSAQLSQLLDGSMPRVRLCLAHAGPPQEAPRPVPLAHLVLLAELMVVDGPVRLVQRVGALCAAVVGQPRGHAEPCAREQQRLSATSLPIAGARRCRGEEVDQSRYGARGRVRAGRQDARCRQRAGVRDAQQRSGTHGGH